MGRGFVTKKRFKMDKVTKKNWAILKIQSLFRGFKARKQYMIKYRATQKCQANVLTRQTRRAFQKLKQDATMAQAYIKRYLAMSWYARVRD